MSYKKKIEIYIQLLEFNTPLAETPNAISKTEVRDHVVIIDNEVWIRNGDNEVDEFSKAIYSAEFVRINKLLFKKIWQG